MSESDMLLVEGLLVNRQLCEFIENEVLTRVDIEKARFWKGLEKAIRELGPVNLNLLQRRDSFQAQLDSWCEQHQGNYNIEESKKFLRSIDYLLDEPDQVQISVSDVDKEIAEVAGPQLVVPLNISRFALNAANARWGSLYDALYGSDIIPETGGQEKGTTYNKIRGKAVIALAMEYLDHFLPLHGGSWKMFNEILPKRESDSLQIQLRYEQTSLQLKDPKQLIGYTGEVGGEKFSLLFCHHGLHIELFFDNSRPPQHPSSLQDVVLESAISTIQDCEDSVAVVCAKDKLLLYRNWLGLISGDLTAEVPKKGGTIKRRLNPDRSYESATKLGEKINLPGRSLMLIRNTAHHVYTKLVTLAQVDQPIPETFLDGFITSLIGCIDLQGKTSFKNSRTGSIYIVKPKLHGPEEVALCNRLFGIIEDTLGLTRYTIKLGLMDEERRTSINLKACVAEISRRAIFINTGFLDRTGDEIHSSFRLGPFQKKNKLKDAKWMEAYEALNVRIGLECGFIGKGQIGRGMWAEPDGMAAMLKNKINHPMAGATTAWVPSPTAATIHAIHYHQIDVKQVQQKLIQAPVDRNQLRDNLFAIPLLPSKTSLSAEEIQRDLENDLQGLLGYVVRWIDQGVGCSKVPDINGTGLMEDRATLRISSQHVANWLWHGLITEAQIFDCMRSMASIVDSQNKDDSKYKAMASHPFTSIAFQTALDLVFKGDKQPNGYTEFTLHKRRLELLRKELGQDFEDPAAPLALWSKM